MRVRSLELRNYRRHVHTRLELPDGITALVGLNGSGKSSLLEALGFALFGTDALRTSKTLLRNDATAPGDSVEVRAELELGGQAISITRELRGKALTPSASLTIDGAVIVPAGAGSSEAATQQLQRRLGLDADAFFTTVVARQGDLANLVQQAPAERKRLVLRMLGVDRLDAAIDRARLARRDADATAKALRSAIPDLAVLEQRLGEASREADTANAAVPATQLRLTHARAALVAASAHLAECQRQSDQRRETAAQVEAVRRELALHEHAARAAQAAEAEATAALGRAAGLAPAAARYPALQQEWLAAQRTQQLAQHRLTLLQSLQKLEREASTARLAMPPLGVGEAIPLGPLEKALEDAQQNTERLGSALEVARAAASAADARLGHLVHLGAGAPCPTCERPLEGLAATLVQATTQAVETGRALCEQLARELALARRDVATARQQLAAAQQANQRRELLAVEAAAQARALATLERRVAEARAALPAEVAGPDLIGLQAALDEARKAHEARQSLEGVAQRLPTLRLATQNAVTLAAAQRERCTVLETALASLPDASVELAFAQQTLTNAQRSERAADLELHASRVAAEAAQRRLEDLRRTRAEADALALRLTAAERDLREWTALTDGRAGLLERFRDHVVDRIGPAIQAEASRLLAAFTGGRYTELLLDADYGLFLSDGGVRYNLERFSGGEQDVAHLALRLAVSRLLAERAGATELRFLALDEVFGHLDDARRGMVVDALHGLSGLYAQVLVVSHLESLNDSLDQAIAVELVDGESRVTLRNG